MNIIYRPSEDLVIHVTPEGDTFRYTPAPPPNEGFWLTNGRFVYDESHLLMTMSDQPVGTVELLDDEFTLITTWNESGDQIN